MKKSSMPLLIVAVTLVIALPAWAAPKSGCTTIQSGTLFAKNGAPLVLGYDAWGYNYQAMTFNGYYDNYMRSGPPVTSGDQLAMKWNDAWLSNKDCDGDGTLDRHYGLSSYIGSGAWLTNHQHGTYEGDAGQACHYTYFIKIVAAPADAALENGVWKTSGGIDIGPAIWGDFAIIQEVSNDDCAGQHGVLYRSPAAPGLGAYKP